MSTFSAPRSAPVTLSSSTESQVYALFALALGLTTVGVFLGMTFAASLFGTPAFIAMTVAEFALLLSAPFWMNRNPLNMVLFLAFPLLSGITATPYLAYVLTGYANGGAILLNAFGATACTALAAAVVARSGINLQGLRGFLVFGLLGMIVFILAQLFVPALRGSTFDILLSGFSIVLFSGFTAYDLQRIMHMGRIGENPFMLALSLYLDIFNLFMSVVRFMTAVSGRRD